MAMASPGLLQSCGRKRNKIIIIIIKMVIIIITIIKTTIMTIAITITINYPNVGEGN